MFTPEKSTNTPLEWFVSCAKGLEPVLATEIQSLGGRVTREVVAGVYVEAPQVFGLRMVLWSRVANRVIRLLGVFSVKTADELYEQLVKQDWQAWIRPNQSLTVDFHGTNESLRNTQFSAQKVKDAIVDRLSATLGARPNVDRKVPDIRFNCHLKPQGLSIGIDYGDGSLHWRGYRTRSGAAPLKETLAAAILMRAGWPELVQEQGALVDPMCGTGTLLIEGAMMAADIAPGLRRKRCGFERLPDFMPEQWRILKSEAEKRAEAGKERLQDVEIRGYDADARAVRAAEENIETLGLSAYIRVSTKPLAKLAKPTHRQLNRGLVVCNPPYGERLGEAAALRYLYNQLGERASQEFRGWELAVLAGEVAQSKAVGLRSHKQYVLYNGALAVHLALFSLGDDNRWKDLGAAQQNVDEAKGTAATGIVVSEGTLTAGGQMFLNRVRKNRKRLKGWLKQTQTQCYRLYDADMPEYAVAVDVYDGSLHLAEYQAPKHVDEDAAIARLEDAIHALCVEFKVAPSQIAVKQRRRQRGQSQYEKRGSEGRKQVVREGKAKLLVNLQDYLDTGLFLDHRPMRARIAAEAKGGRFLNLFCYTGTASIHAALAGAKRTVSVDLSNTYTAWYRENLALNGLAEATNVVVRSDVAAWLDATKERFDLILLDPPSFSNSKKTEQSFDVQRDQLALVHAAMSVLEPKGVLYFSNNRRGFKLDDELGLRYEVRDISAQTLDPDFERNPKIHQAWALRHSDS